MSLSVVVDNYTARGNPKSVTGPPPRYLGRRSGEINMYRVVLSSTVPN